jgi:hypothetical protein
MPAPRERLSSTIALVMAQEVLHMCIAGGRKYARLAFPEET